MRGPRLVAGPYALLIRRLTALFEQEQFLDPQAPDSVKPELLAFSDLAAARDMVAERKTVEAAFPEIFNLVSAIADDSGTAFAGVRHFQKVGDGGDLGDDLGLGADRQLA